MIAMRRGLYLLMAWWVVACVATRGTAAITDGLVGYWPFDEKSGTNAADASGAGRNGNLANFPRDGSQWVPGQIGGSLEFTGTNSVVVTNFSNPISTMTFSAWVWADSVASWERIATAESFGFLWYGSLDVYLAEKPFGGGYNVWDTGNQTSLPLQSWHHVGFVADGSSLWQWQDGQLVGTLAYNGTLHRDVATGHLAIGEGWHGKIDEVAFWTRALSADEIFDLYQAGLAGRPLIQVIPNVVAWGDNTRGQINVPPTLSNAVAVAGGSSHSLALKRDGTVIAWGGYPGLTNVPPGLTGVMAIAAGSYHNLALTRDGTVAAWGLRISPNFDPIISLAGLTNAMSVAAGFSFNLALNADGTVVEWPEGWFNVAPPRLTNAIAIAESGGNPLALTSDGTVVSWDGLGNEQRMLPGLSNLVGIAVGSAHNLALKADGTVVGWGDNSYGQTTIPAGLNHVTAIAAGGSHSLACKADGTVVAWGNNSHGQSDVPAGLSNVVSIAAGTDDSLAVVGTGPPMLAGVPAQRRVYTGTPAVMLASAVGQFPLNYQWQFNGTNVPGATNSFLILTNVHLNQSGAYTVVVSNVLGMVTSANTVLTAIESAPIIDLQPTNQTSYPGAGITLRVLAEGTAPLEYQWLFNGGEIPGATSSTLVFGAVRPDQAGRYAVRVRNPVGTIISSNAMLSIPSMFAWGRNAEGETNVPVGLEGVLAVASGDSHCLALRRDGTVVAWGDDSHGQTNVPDVLSNVVAIAAGANHSLALGKDGSVIAWGDNRLGQTDVPAGISNVVAIAGGAGHSLALTAGGGVTAWGDDSRRQADVPAGLTNVVAIAAGARHSLALKATGTVIAWGDNSYGEANVPGDLDNVIAVSAGQRHSLALRGDGSVVGWGDNSSGQLDPPPGLTDVVAIAAGSAHSLALQADGVLIAWGGNNQGQARVPISLVNVIGIAAGAAHTLVLAGDGTPVLVAPSTVRTAYTGTGVRLNAGVIGSPPVAYQWQIDGTNIPVATNFFLGLSNVQLNFTGTYSVVASNALGSAGRLVRLEVVESAPIIIGQPADQSTYPGGGTATFRVVAEGSEPLFYEWFLNGIQIPGANSNLFSLNDVRLRQAGQYSVSVLNLFGETPSQKARLSIGPVIAWGTYRGATPGSTGVPAYVPGDLTNVVAIAGGYAHSLALTDAGRVVAWGYETNSPGINTAFRQTVVPAGLSNVVAVAASAFDSLAVKGDGTVALWGMANVPLSLLGRLTNVVALAGGYGTMSLGLRADGTVAGWGGAKPPAGLHRVVAIAAGESQGLGLRDDGTVIFWPFLLGVIPHDLTNLIAIAAGRVHSLALRADGTVVAWGTGPGTNVPPDLRDVVEIAAGADNSLALKSDGTVVAWGAERPPPGLTNVIGIASGPAHSLAIVGEGTRIRVSEVHLARLRWLSTGDAPWFAETNVTYDSTEALQSGVIPETGQSRLQTIVFGPGTLSFWWRVSSEPGRGEERFYADGVEEGVISGEVDWVQRVWVVPPGFHRLEWDYSKNRSVSSGPDAGWLARVRFNPRGALAPLITGPPTSQTAFLGTSATLAMDVLGVEPISYQWQFNGTNLFGATNAALTLSQVDLTAAGGYSVVVSNAFGQSLSGRATLSLAQVLGWGNNSSGQTNLLAGVTKVVAIASGSSFNLALSQAGTVTAWGDTTGGLAIDPETFASVVAIAAGGRHALALRSDATVIAWGDDSSGQTDVPLGLTNVVGIAAGQGVSLGLKADGAVVAWGSDTAGERDVPPGLTGVVDIACGGYHCLALRSDGTVAAWGLDRTGQIDVPPQLTNAVAIAAGTVHSVALRADGTVVTWGGDINHALQMPPGLTNIVAIAAAGFHTLALRADGTLVAWGQDSSGEGDVPDGLANVVAIGAGYQHSLVLVGQGPPPPRVTPPPRLLTPSLEGNRFAIQVPSALGRVLRLEFEDSLTETNWVPLPLVLGDGALKLLVDSRANGPQRVYRVRQFR